MCAPKDCVFWRAVQIICLYCKIININFCQSAKIKIPLYAFIYIYTQARPTRTNSGGVAEGHPRFDKGGVAIIFYFLRVKNRTF